MALVVLGIGCAVALGCILVALRGRRRSVSEWSSTRGTVLSSTVQVANGASRRGSPLVLYSYQVGGAEFQGSRVRLGAQLDEADVIVGRYPAGACVEVYYDPADPTFAVLEPWA